MTTPAASQRGPSQALCLGLVALASAVAWLVGGRMAGTAPEDASGKPAAETARRTAATGADARESGGPSRVDALPGILEIQDDRERTIALLKWLDRLPAKEFQQILESWSKSPQNMSRSREQLLILQAWTQVNPEAAASWVADRRDFDLGEVLFMWALRDPQAASDWVDHHAPGSRSENAKSGVMKGIVESSPDLGRSRWAALTEEDQERFVDAVEKPLLARGIDSAIAWIGSFPDQLSRDRFSCELAEGLAKVDAAKAAEWSATIVDDKARTVAWHNIAEVWAAKDSAAAKQWASGLPPGEERGGAIAAVTAEIRRSDLRTAREWLESLGGGSELDTAHRLLANTLAETDPREALDYATRIRSQEDRLSLKEGVIEDWWKEDQPAARAWLSAHPEDLDAEWVGKMLARPEGPSKEEP